MTERARPGPSDPGTVVLELGPGIGALILDAPAALDGAEIEISRDGRPRTHALVRPRHAPGRTGYAAVYPDLPPGEYTVWRAGGPAGTVTVREGQVSRFRWPG